MLKEQQSNVPARERKKVLIVVHQLNYGGAQKALLSALDAIDHEQYEVTLYVRKARLELLPEVNPAVSRVVVNGDHTHYYRKPYAVFLQFMDFLCSRGGRKPSPYGDKLRDYVVTQGMRYEKKRYFSDGTVYDTAVSYLQGRHALFVSSCVDAKRKVMFYHGSTDELHELHERILADFSSVYCVSEPAQRELRRCYPTYAERIKCLENVIDAELIRAKAAEYAVRVPENSVVLCTCGRFAPVKGFDLAVEAAAKLRETGLRFYWFFVGDGPERASLERQIGEKGLRGCIEITGMQGNPYPYINACDIYVQPSREEAQGLALLEAQALRRPAVSTRTAGGTALIRQGETGLLADIDPSALAEMITDLANDTALRKRMQNTLGEIDFEGKQRRFREEWAELLEGEVIEIQHPDTGI